MRFNGLALKIWRIRQHITALMVVIVCSLFVSLMYRQWNFDDSFIVYRVVERILDGSGWSFNDGEAINVSTSVLNTILITVVAALGITVPTAAHFIGFFGLVLAGCASYILFAKTITWVLAAVSSCLLVYFMAINLTWGLETNLFIGLLFLFMSLPERDAKSGQAVAGFLILARPDGLLIPMIQMSRRIMYFGWRQAIQPSMLLILLILLPWIIFSLVSFHQLFPDTLTQKMWQARSGIWGQGNIYAQHLLNHLVSFSPFGIPVWITYPLAFVGTVKVIACRSPLIYLGLFAVIQQAVYLMLIVPGYHWYTSTIDTAIVVFAMFGLNISIIRVTSWIMDRWSDLRETVQTLTPFFLNPVSMIVMVLLSGWVTVFSLRWAYLHPLSDLRTEAYRKATEVVETLSPNTTSFSAFEVGVFGYYLPRATVIDLTGLTSIRGEFITGTRNDQFFEQPPDIFIAYNPPTHFEKPIMRDPRFLDQYRLIGESKISGFSNINIFKKMAESAMMGAGDKPDHIFVPLLGSTCDARTASSGLITVDEINGKAFSSNIIRIGRLPLSIRGWATDIDKSNAVKEMLLILRDEKGVAYAVPLESEERIDLVNAFGRKELINAGFNGFGRVKGLASGFYDLQVCGRIDNSIVLCKTGVRVSID